MINYSTNWMGPISLNWYMERGLDYEKDRYCCGRIDIYGTDDPYPQEMSLPMMKESDWYSFSEWLFDIHTETVYNLDMLVEMYEKTNPKICWYENK